MWWVPLTCPPLGGLPRPPFNSDLPGPVIHSLTHSSHRHVLSTVAGAKGDKSPQPLSPACWPAEEKDQHHLSPVSHGRGLGKGLPR